MLLMYGLEKGIDWMRATGGDGGLDRRVEGPMVGWIAFLFLE